MCSYRTEQLAKWNFIAPDQSFSMHHSDVKPDKHLHFYPQNTMKTWPFRSVAMASLKPAVWCAHNKLNALQNCVTFLTATASWCTSEIPNPRNGCIFSLKIPGKMSLPGGVSMVLWKPAVWWAHIAQNNLQNGILLLRKRTLRCTISIPNPTSGFSFTLKYHKNYAVSACSNGFFNFNSPWRMSSFGGSMCLFGNPLLGVHIRNGTLCRTV